jgi:hypothetical protein
MTKPSKPDTPHRIKLQFRKHHRDNPARELVLVMQRFAARVCEVFPQAVVKGGLGLELRLDTPRTTEDVDIIIAASHNLDTRLSEAGRLDLGDFMRFRVSPDKGGAEFMVPGMPYPARRYLIQSFFTDTDPHALPDKHIDRKFKLEVSIREAAAFEMVESRWEGFPQVRVAPIRVYGVSWQIAGKVHAYCDPRHRESANPDMWRPRDLLDICRCASTIISTIRIDAHTLRNALEQTFAKRKAATEDMTLPELPERLPPLPPPWVEAFQRQVEQASLPWSTPDAAHRLAAAFVDPVLAGTAQGTWRPDTQSWS